MRASKEENHKTLHQILIVIDDFADNPEFSRQSRLLHSLFTRGVAPRSLQPYTPFYVLMQEN